MDISEEHLMAYADGEADARIRAAVEAAMAADAGLRARVEAHRRLRGKVAGASGGAANARPSRPAQIVDLAAVRARKAQPKAKPAQRRTWLPWAALAGCVAVGVIMARGLGGGMSGLGETPVIEDRGGSLMAQGALARALDQQIASKAPGPNTPVRIGESFRAADRNFCRTFQVMRGDGLAGLACREPAGWAVRVAAAPAEAVNASGYRTAASALPPAIAATVNALIDGSPLDAQAEAAAKAKGWRGN